MPEVRKMTRSEVGKLGGQARLAKYGVEALQVLAKRGGDATSASHDAAYYRELGRKGGYATARNNFGGTKKYQTLGRMKPKQTEAPDGETTGA
jgi:hypothetical protein